MGNDSYEIDHPLGAPDLGVGAGSTIENAIIDKNARVGRNVQIRNLENLSTYDSAEVIIPDGIAVVPRDGIAPDGYVI
jgi:glucose-1-phosphate adenylyltransferase